MKKTRHAKVRLQQRGIREHLIPLIIEYGRYSHCPGGATAITLGGKGVDEVTKNVKKVLQAVPKLRDVTIIMSDDGHVITAYHANS